MITKDEYIGFDFKALFFYILRKWKGIVAFALAVALALGMAGMFADKGKEPSHQFVEEIEYILDCLEVTQEKIDVAAEYLDSSLLMGLDYSNVYIAETAFYVQTDYKIIPDSFYQDADKTDTIVAGYKTALSDLAIYESLAQKLNTEEKYIEELVECYVSSNDNATLKVKVRHSDSETAQMIAKEIESKLMAQTDFITDKIGEHKITKVSGSCSKFVDTELLTQQQTVRDDMLKQQKYLVEYEKEMTKLKAKSDYGLYINGSNPEKVNVKGFVKWFVLGGVAAGFVAVFALLALSLVKKVMHSASQVEESYGIKVVGHLPYNKKAGAVDRLINRLEGCSEKFTEACAEYMAEILKQECKTAQNLLVCGGKSAEFVAQQLGAYSQQTLTAGGDIFTDVKALTALAECDGVLLVVERDKTTDGQIKKMLELFTLYGKNVTGAVIAG